MEIYINKKISGVSILKIKKLLVTSKSEYLFFDTIAKLSELKETAAVIKLIRALETEAYIIKIPKLGGWASTIKGINLADTQLKRVIDRPRAEEIIMDCIQRMNKINTDPHYLFYITNAYVYGEYLVEQLTELTSIQLTVDIERKEQDYEKFEELSYQRIKQSNKSFSNSLDYLFYPEYEVFKFLKSGTHNLIITRISAKKEKHFEQRPSKLIFSFK